MAASENIQAWVKADLNFHVAVLAASRNQLLIPLSTVISSALEMLLSFSARRASNFKKALPDHGKVLEAIRAQDERGAFTSMQKLLSDTRAWRNADRPEPARRASI
uniref:Transcriptional regulator, GntR family n=1 Tax=mine drainage metagenome TaxID=410659 RepID=E6PTR7_9ZZZZ